MSTAGSPTATAASPIMVAPLGDAAAAFTGRADGNASLLVGGGDALAARRKLAPLAGAEPERIVFAEQVHGAGVALVDSRHAGAGLADHAQALPGADALVTTTPGLALAVLTADCVPLLLAADGAVAAVHAGRAGLLAGVVEATLETLESVAVPPGRVSALIGPAIDGCCYELPADEAAATAAALPETASATTWGTPSVALRSAVAAVLRRAGVARIALAGGCTRCEPSAWFSHRASTDARGAAAEPGRQASVIALADPAARPVPTDSPARGLRLAPQWLS